MQSTSADNEQRSNMAGTERRKYNFRPLSHRTEQEMEEPEEIIERENSPHGLNHERNGLANSTQTKRHVVPYDPGSPHHILDSTGKRGEENRNYNPRGGPRKETTLTRQQ